MPKDTNGRPQKNAAVALAPKPRTAPPKRRDKGSQLASELHQVRQKARQLASELHRARCKARQLGGEFLLTELQLAEAFLDLAATTSNAAASRRNLQNTAKALNAVARFIETMSPELPQRAVLARRAAELRARLLDTGSRLSANGGPEPFEQQGLREGDPRSVRSDA